MRVFITEGMHESGIELLRQNKIKIVNPNDSYAKDEIEALVVRSVFEVNEETLRLFPNLKVVAKLGTGLDNIDQQLCEIIAC